MDRSRPLPERDGRERSVAVLLSVGAKRPRALRQFSEDDDGRLRALQLSPLENYKER